GVAALGAERAVAGADVLHFQGVGQAGRQRRQSQGESGQFADHACPLKEPVEWCRHTRYCAAGRGAWPVENGAADCAGLSRAAIAKSWTVRTSRCAVASLGSVTNWIGELKAGNSATAQELWERYFARMVELARKKLHASPRRAADEEDVALSAFDSFWRGAAQERFPKLAGDTGVSLHCIAHTPCVQ